jgi:hypothetical protein
LFRNEDANKHLFPNCREGRFPERKITVKNSLLTFAALKNILFLSYFSAIAGKETALVVFPFPHLRGAAACTTWFDLASCGPVRAAQ